jgi:serine/threonine protein kinase
MRWKKSASFVFFAMAYVEGETLTERVRRRGPLAPSDGSRMLRDVAWALAYAHTQGVIHRDVKPDNILLENTGRVLVADFGIAGVVADAGGLNTGEIIGTPEFMSPEQALGETVDARSDLYSLGVVGYFALSGQLPFEAENATDVLAKQVTELAAPLVSVAPLVPRRMAQAIDRCLAKERNERPEGPAVLAEQLTHTLEKRRELPVALRAFVKHDARLDGSGVYCSIRSPCSSRRLWSVSGRARWRWVLPRSFRATRSFRSACSSIARGGS